MKAALFRLRSEYHVSGEHNSTLALLSTFTELGIEVENLSAARPATQGALRLRNLFDPVATLRQSSRARREAFDIVFAKIPTVAQLPLTSLLLGSVSAPLVVLLDGMCSGGANAGSLWRELRYEPALALGKRLANHPLWARLPRRKPRAIIGCAQAQIEQARRIVGDGVDYYVIANSSPADRPLPAPAPRDRARVQVGYLGHAYAFKGCVDLIDARAHLAAPERFAFTAAFSGSCRPGVVERWRSGGGETLGIVEPGAFLAGLDVACVPLYTQFGTKVFPNVLLETMRCGTPLLTTRSALTEELLGRDPPFPLLDRVTPRHIARGLERLAALDRATIGRFLVERFQQYDYGVIRGRWRQVIEDIVAHE